MSACTRAPRARRGILVGVGGSCAPRAPPVLARRAQRARAGLAGGSEGLWCAARPATAERDPHADGARARPDVWRCSACCQDPPSHGQHARRARGGCAQAARKVVATQGVAPGYPGVAPSGNAGHRPDVRAPTFGGALRSAETHPVTASTLGARVVAVLRPLVRWWPPRGGGIQRKVQIEPFVVRAEGPTRVRGGLSSGGQASNLYQGGWNTISAFFGATPNLSLQCSMPAGHVPSRAVRLTLRRTRIHSSHLWRL